MAFLRLCVHRRYGQAHPGIIERVRDYFVIRHPGGDGAPDPLPVRAAVLAHHAPCRVVVRPF
jgi:hypothetical protein